MSTDKPSGGGDHRPDQAPRPEHKPFPGTPDSRPPVPPPTGTKTADQMRAERAKYNTTSEYLAAKTAEKTAARQAPAKDTSEGAQVPEGPHPAGNVGPPHNPDSSAAQRGDKGGILHGHAEFHRQNLDLYSDGTRWVSGDAVQSAREEAARAQAEGRPAPQRHDITSIPQMRDLGRNAVGEKEERSPGDTGDLAPAGQDLVEMEDKDAPLAKRFGRKLARDYGDIVDTAKNETDYVTYAMKNPMPTGHAETTPPAKAPGYSDVLSHGAPDPSAIVEAGLVAGLVLFHAGQAIAHRVNRERRSEDGGH